MHRIETMAIETISAGAIGGFLATVVTILLLRTSVFDRPTIIEDVLEKYTSLSSDRATNLNIRRGIQLVYGTVAGAVLGGLAPFFPQATTIPMWIALGVMFSIAMLVVGNKFWIEFILDGDQVQDMPLSFAALQVVYGVIVGLTIALLTL